MIIELSKYNEHCNLHIDPKFLTPETNNNNMRRLNINDYLNDTDADSADITIKSMLPEQIPQP
jgi:hypothetical protein